VSDQAILIVGGYGVVGRRIADELGIRYPGRVIIAGRNLARATSIAAALGAGVRGRAVDIVDPSAIATALEGVAIVISCIDQPGRLLLKAAIAGGLGYTDITPHLTELGRDAAYREIQTSARSSGAKLMLGSGIVPGISNVMARALADSLGGADEIETALLLGAHDVSGPASFDYFLQELAMPFRVYIDGKDHPARAFMAPRLVEFPVPIGRRRSYLFPFSDQVLYPQTMGVRTAVTRLAIEPEWLARLVEIASASGIARLLASGPIRHTIARRRQDRPSIEGAPFALRVDVTKGSISKHATLLGRTQADAAALGALELARLLIEGELHEPGAWMPEQVVKPAPFLSRLAEHGLKVEFSGG
jgi:saccharopine dehydrogenase (NAD+, L-lysine forming)